MDLLALFILLCLCLKLWEDYLNCVMYCDIDDCISEFKTNKDLISRSNTSLNDYNCFYIYDKYKNISKRKAF